MLIDDVIITVKAGNGGNGSAALKRNAQTAKGGPDGGNAGNGGSVYAIGTTDITALQQFQFKKLARGEDGVNGQKKNLFGRNGADLVIKVPLGTRITDIEAKWIYEIEDTTTKFLLCQGGKGGRGNNEFKTATNQTPMYAENGEPGEEKTIHLVLRLIADIGFIGLPNAGKSSLLSVLTNATPKIGNYQFTTLEPNLGMMEGRILTDIPGLIEGASTGKGLGIKFLKHIEKTKVLVHCIDASDPEPVKTYKIVRKEFESFNKELLTKPEIILLTKSDLVEEKDLKKKKKLLEKCGKVSTVTIYDDTSIEELKKNLKKFL